MFFRCFVAGRLREHGTATIRCQTTFTDSRRIPLRGRGGAPGPVNVHGLTWGGRDGMRLRTFPAETTRMRSQSSRGLLGGLMRGPRRCRTRASTRASILAACALLASTVSAQEPAAPVVGTLQQGIREIPSATASQQLGGPLEPVTEPIAAARPGVLPAFIYGNGVFDAETPDMVMTLRGGVRFSPAYFGSSTIRTGPDVGLRIDHLELPGGLSLGSNSTVGFLRGFGPRLSARYIRRRNSDGYDEIRGLDDVPFALELGVGLGYERRNYRAFADVRYGAIGHDAWVSDVGADAISYPYEGLTLTLGPRVSFGSQKFMDTYFGIKPDESQDSGLAEFQPEPGIYGAGMELGARYLFNERWGIEGAARWTRLMNSSADSPIVTGGADDQYMVRFDISRRISLDF